MDGKVGSGLLIEQSSPRLSVLTTVWNGERFLDEAIRSVLEQDFADFELIIVDDGSTDATPRILDRWVSRDARLRILRNATNLGIAAAANRGLAAARAAYVARLDADDLCMKGRFAAQIDVLDRERDTVLVSTCYELIDEHGRTVDIALRSAPPEVIADLLHFSNAIGGHSQVMFRRDVVRELGGYDENFDVCVDYELWSRLIRRGRFVVLPILGMKYRLHPARVSVVKRERQQSNSHLIAGRMLASFFGEEVSGEDLAALASVWRNQVCRGVASRGHRLLTRAYDLFRAANDDAHHRAHVRRETARRWTSAAFAFARRRELREAMTYLAYALRWHPRGLFDGIAAQTMRWFRAVRPSLRRDRRDYAGAGESKSVIPLA